LRLIQSSFADVNLMNAIFTEAGVLDFNLSTVQITELPGTGD